MGWEVATRITKEIQWGRIGALQLLSVLAKVIEISLALLEPMLGPVRICKGKEWSIQEASGKVFALTGIWSVKELGHLLDPFCSSFQNCF